jgi:dynein assembly factor with WDR repeat domains 1
MIATGSMDNTARLWDVETGECLHTLLGHTAEIVSLDFDTQGQRIITGSFDNSVKVWDVRNGRCIHSLIGHQGEISSCQFNYASDLCISGSIDRTCKVIILEISSYLALPYYLYFRSGMSEVERVSTLCVATMMKF